MTEAEKKNCQNCHVQFVIEPDDFLFYERISVPPPTFCPDCRLQRRLMFRNERSLSRTPCALCGKQTLSMYSPERPAVVYCVECWWADSWDASQYGRNYDFSKPFFEQYKELLAVVPRQGVFIINGAGTMFANFSRDAKNIYLSYSALGSENVSYSKNVDKSFWIMDSFDVSGSENCYEVVEGDKDYSCQFLSRSRNCIDSAFLYDCTNCQHCFMCTGLRNKEYCVRNRDVSKDEYEAEIFSFQSGSFSAVETLRAEFRGFIERAIHRYAYIVNSPGCTGENIQNSKNAFMAFDARNLENAKYQFRSIGGKDIMDAVNAGPGNELFYEFINGGSINSSLIRFTTNGSDALRDTYYTDFCRTSSNLFGCAGLRNKRYCVLNKEYSKEEYEALVPRIKKHMDDMPYTDAGGRVYRYGEFFPPELSFFAYNETLAQEYFPLTKEGATAKGFAWRELVARDYQPTRSWKDLPDRIADADDSLANEIILCRSWDADAETALQHTCTKAFRITPEDLAFYRRMNLPLPRLCPNCRHYERLKQRNPLKLWHRQCMCDKTTHQHGEKPCTQEFETSYAPERKEIVHCEQCYNSEVV